METVPLHGLSPTGELPHVRLSRPALSSLSPHMRVLRKLIALAVYAVMFLPTADYRTTAWIRALEVTSTSLDKTLRRRKSRLENDRLARHMEMNELDVPYEEQTMRSYRV